MKKNNASFAGISPEAVMILRDIKSKVDSGEEDDEQIIEALRALDIASKVVNTIMSGNQIDPVFFKHLSDLTQEKIMGQENKPKPKILNKKRRFKRK